jgi:hypothetical protein
MRVWLNQTKKTGHDREYSSSDGNHERNCVESIHVETNKLSGGTTF